MDGVWERAIREVLCFQEVSGATRRDRTGDLLITNQVEQVFWRHIVF